MAPSFRFIFVAIMSTIDIGCKDKNDKVHFFALDLLKGVISDILTFFESPEDPVEDEK